MRVLIFSGGYLDSYALSHIAKGDYIIGVDRGAFFLYSHHIKMNVAIGDFDSVTAEEANFIHSLADEMITCDPIQKDETDTEMAFQYALKLKPAEIVIFGGLGNRFDHSIANIHLLYQGLKAGVLSRIVGKTNEILLINNTLMIENDHYPYVSLLPFTTEVHGITLTGFLYPLLDATIKIGESIGISNMLVDQVGRIELTSGILMVIKSKDSECSIGTSHINNGGEVK